MKMMNQHRHPLQNNNQGMGVHFVLVEEEYYDMKQDEPYLENISQSSIKDTRSYKHH
jgi:hypothetical protein